MLSFILLNRSGQMFECCHLSFFAAVEDEMSCLDLHRPNLPAVDFEMSDLQREHMFTWENDSKDLHSVAQPR